MKCLQGKWFKRFLYIFISVFIIFLILSFGLTLYINKILTYDKLLQLSQKYSQLYLNRNLTFKSYKVNIFKGIILNGVAVEKNNGIKNTTGFVIEEINLRYDFRKLLKLKLYIDKVVVKSIILEINKKIIQSEWDYYKEKFTSYQTNSGGLPEFEKKEKKVVNIKSIEIIDSEIIYKHLNKKIKFIINDFEFKDEEIKKINNDIIIQYLNNKIAVKGNIFFNEKAVLNWNVDVPEKLSLKLNVETTNFTNFLLKAGIDYKKNHYNLSSFFQRKEKNIIVSSLLFCDYKNRVTLSKGLLNLTSLNVGFKLSSQLKDIDNEDIKNFINIDKYNFKANLDIDLFVGLNLNNWKNIKLNGRIIMNNCMLESGGEKFFFDKGEIIVKNNEVNIKSGMVRYKGYDFQYELFKKDLFNRFFPYHIKIKSSKVNLNQFIKHKNFLLKNNLYNLSLESTLSLKNRLINFKNINFDFLHGQVCMKGIINFKNKNELLLEFNQEIKDMNVNKLMESYKIKDITGTIQAQSILRVSIFSNKKFKLNKLKGEIKSQMDYKNLNNLNLNVVYKLRKNKIYFYKSYLNYDYNRIDFWGKYNLKDQLLTLNGVKNRLFLASLKFLEQKVQGIVGFDFVLKKKAAQKMNIKIKLNSGEVIYQNLKFKNINGNVAINSNRFEGKLNINDFYKGKINTEIKGDFNNNFNISANGEKVKISPLSKDFFNQDISGILDFDMSFNYKKESKTGTINIKAQKGEISDTIFQKKLSGILSLAELQDIFYKDIVFSAALENKLIKFNTFKIKCTDQEYNIQGQYSFKNKKINLIIFTKLHEEFMKNIPNLVLPVIHEKGSWYYIKPIEVKGKDGEIKTKFK